MQTDATIYQPALVITPEEREAVFSLRIRVFVHEQNVPQEEELDRYDITATHFLVRAIPDPPEVTLGIIGAARLVDYGDRIGKVGRVAVEKEYRGSGIGLMIMKFIEEHARGKGFQKLILDSQVYAIPFYARLGYVAEGDVFLDAGIEHRRMTKGL